MKLPDICPLEDVPSEQLAAFETQSCNCCRARSWLCSDEPPLCQGRETEAEVYRFLWESSFNGAALVRIARAGDIFRLNSRFLRYSRLYLDEPTVSIALSSNEWARLQQELTASSFWTLNETDRRMGFDGSNWLIEGRHGNAYKWVERWSPQGAIRDLGLCFFALAGVPYSQIKLS